MKHYTRWSFLLMAVCTAFMGSIFGQQEAAHFLSVSTAYAKTQLSELVFRPLVEVNDKRVSLLDLCEQTSLTEDWKTLFSGVDICPAPEEGSEKYINPEQLRIFVQHMIQSQGFSRDSTKIIIPEQITLARKEIRLTSAQIEEIYKQFILSNVPWKKEDVVIHHVYCPDPPVLLDGDMTYEVVVPSRALYLGSVAATIHFFVNGRQARSTQVTGKVDLYQDVVHSRNRLKRNDIITENDIQLARINISDHPDRYAAREEEVVGKRLLSSVGLNQPISLRDLAKPLAVRRGDNVTIIYRYNGLTLTAMGQARENGSEGARVRVTNADSKQTIFCQVIDSRTVEVMTSNH